ncbi:threonine/homoserine/homoserine lactone efflux protein [Rhizobium sp. PP-F2F-G48]|uniref:LysE family translocator n=1 Tax=Rhizobium sp. PP-F2F-G48 TaxID=2135651 RepID=UPI0010E35158|nr:LysE family translocator [Rhizobium sp. PP-F2F-G48]TCM53561.1 threonine/homoserine/homoserine lactone efflux protein [Rhizobium sp. PP-F2F-G48]
MSSIHSYWPGIMLAYTTYIVSAISPGPAMLATMGTAMESGRKAGIALGLGIALSALIWGALAFLGLSTLLVAYAGILDIVRILGCLYLLYLAWKSFGSAFSSYDLKVSHVALKRHKNLNVFLHGCILNLANPKAVFTWVAIISLAIEPGAPLWTIFAVLGGTIGFSVVFYTFIAIVFSTPSMISIYSRSRRWIDFTLGLVFTFSAYELARD